MELFESPYFARHGRMPAQWERHAATIMAYPFDNELWFGRLEEIRSEYDALIETIAQSEKVLLIVPPEEISDIRTRQFSKNINVTLMAHSLNDVWLRDSGPLFVFEQEKNLNGHFSPLAFDFIFNAWGDKFGSKLDDKIGRAIAHRFGAQRLRIPFVFEGGSLDVNGQGVGLTTRQCLLESKRNTVYSESEIHTLLCHLFDLKELIWLDEGLEGDHTDGHIDTIARFINHETVVCHVAEDRNHPSFLPLQRNFEQLSALAQSEKSAIKKVIGLPVPVKTQIFEGEFVPFSYANFYFCNAGLIVPQFGDSNDSVVLELLQKHLPGTRVIGLSAQAIVLGGGVFNCLTQQVPHGIHME